MSEKKFRVIIAFMALLIGAVGFALIVDSNYTPSAGVGGGSVAGATELRLAPNSPLNISSNLQERSSRVDGWSQSLDSGLDENNPKTYIGFSTASDYYVSTINSDLEFEILFQLEDEPDLITVYGDFNIAYLYKDTFSGTKTFVLASRESAESYLLPIESKITSFMYDPDQSVFYFSAASDLGEVIIYAMLNNNELVEIDRSTSLSRYSEIIAASQREIYIKSGKNCFVLDQYNKELSRNSCERVFQSLDISFIEKTIYKTYVNHKDMQIEISNDNLTESQSDFKIGAKEVLFMTYYRESIEEKFIYRVPYSSKQRKLYVDELPNKYISDFFQVGELFFITDGNNIYYFDPNSNQSSPSDSLPASYPSGLPDKWFKLETTLNPSGIKILNKEVFEL